MLTGEVGERTGEVGAAGTLGGWVTGLNAPLNAFISTGEGWVIAGEMVMAGGEPTAASAGAAGDEDGSAAGGGCFAADWIAVERADGIGSFVAARHRDRRQQ